MPRTTLALAFVACAPSPSDGAHDDTPPSVTDTGTLSPEDTDPLHEELVALHVTCEVTTNVLRYTCAVHVEPAQAVQVRFWRTDGLGVERVHRSDAMATDHVVPVYFLAGSRTYEIEASPVDAPEHTSTTSFVTEPALPLVNSTLVMTGTSTAKWVGTNTPCSARAIAVVYDTLTGDLVWYHNVHPAGTFGDLNMVRFTPDHTVVGETGEDIVEVDLQGNELAHLVGVNTMLGADVSFWGLHHDVFARDGLYYVLYQTPYGPGNVLDAVAVLDASATLVTTWYPGEHLPLPDAWSGDWLHTNTVWVDENQDLYLSWTGQDTIGKIEGDPSAAEFGTLAWTLAGKVGALGSDIAVDWSMIDGDDNFDYQHDLSLTPQGQIVMLDNGNGRGLVFDLDDTAMTATAVAAYPTELVACGPQGTMALTSAGNAVVGCSEGSLREIDAAGVVVWEMTDVACELPIVTGGAGVRWYPLDDW